MKKNLKRALSAILALVMLFSVASVAANAATASTVRQYKYYVSLGDSIAAGFSRPEYNAYGEYVVPRKNIAGSYPNLLSKAVQATPAYGGTFVPLAAPGFRTQELHFMLDDSYAGDVITKKYVGELADASVNAGYNYENLKTWRSDYQTAVQKADLITLDIGLNDTWLPLSALSLIWRDTGKGATDVTKAIAETLETYGTVGNVLSEGMGALVHLVTIPEFANYLTQCLYDLVAGFYVNYTAIVNRIYELNPDVTLVHLSSYNSFATWQDFPVLGLLLQPVYDLMNGYKQLMASQHDDAYYAEMQGVELITNSLASALNTSNGALNITYNPHPTAQGHIDMTNRILAVLPEGNRAKTSTQTSTTTSNPNYKPLTKVDGVWAYRVNNKIQTSYTGFGESDKGVYYVKNGTVDLKTTGIVTVNNKKYYVVNSKLQSSYTGMVKASSTTYYVKNGEVQSGYSGIVTSNGTKYYVKSGAVQTSYTGIVKGASQSYYVKNGIVDTSFSGNVKSSSKTYTVANGVVTAVK